MLGGTPAAPQNKCRLAFFAANAVSLDDKVAIQNTAQQTTKKT
jgi:hypothetical protein